MPTFDDIEENEMKSKTADGRRYTRIQEKNRILSAFIGVHLRLKKSVPT
jgi:hypothetical protein